ncbi:hypothetical protein BD408DRAFT_409904 [Parasitella parasitica]|nr:hypothetical protein BD408DRAFT_409904 [Parasitella parasitica]
MFSTGRLFNICGFRAARSQFNQSRQRAPGAMINMLSIVGAKYNRKKEKKSIGWIE